MYTLTGLRPASYNGCEQPQGGLSVVNCITHFAACLHALPKLEICSQLWSLAGIDTAYQSRT